MLKLQIYSGKELVYQEQINKVIGWYDSFISLFCGRKSNRYNDIKCLKLEISEIDINLSNGFRFCPPKQLRIKPKYSYYKRIYFLMLPVDSTVRTAKVTGNN
jgi:hypothetical protein